MVLELAETPWRSQDSDVSRGKPTLNLGTKGLLKTPSASQAHGGPNSTYRALLSWARRGLQQPCEVQGCPAGSSYRPVK